MSKNWQYQKYASALNTPLWEMSIPGTHDSCARTNHTAYADKCQNWSITEQLNNGIRFLDLRLNYNNNNNRDPNGFTGFDIYHGGFQYATFKPSWYGVVDPSRADTANVYAEMVDWLVANPTEFVIVNVANTGGTASDEFTDEFWKIITSTSKGVNTPNAELWYLFDLVKGNKADLIYENLKGKFVLIRSDPDWTWSRNGFPKESLGLPCDAYKKNGFSTTVPFFRTQNYWEKVSCDDKKTYINELFGEIQNAHPNEQYIYFNWVSLGFGWSDGGLHGPEYFADRLNPFLTNSIENMVDRNAVSLGGAPHPPYLGVVVMDFPTILLIQRIVGYR